MAILAQLSFRVSKAGPAGAGGFDGQYPTGGGIGAGGGSGYTPEGGGFFPPNVASPYFVPTPVYGPQGPATGGVSGPGVIIVAKLPQGKIMQVDHPPTAIPGAAFNLITRFTHKHTGTGTYTIRVKFPQIGIDSTSPPTTVSQNGVGVIISTVTVPGESATSPIPQILTGTIELIRTQVAGTTNGVTVDAMQVLDDSRVVTITKIGTTPTAPNCDTKAKAHCAPLASDAIHGNYAQCVIATKIACQAGLPLPPISSFPGTPHDCCGPGKRWDKWGGMCVPENAITPQGVRYPICGQGPPTPVPVPIPVPTPGGTCESRFQSCLRQAIANKGRGTSACNKAFHECLTRRIRNSFPR